LKESQVKLKSVVFGLMLVSAVAADGAAAAPQTEKETDRLQNAATVLKEIFGMPDAIPQDLLDKAECVIVFPSVKKVAFGVGGSYGRGVISCRGGSTFDGHWGPPAMFALEGASIGFQLGAQATDFVLLVMNDRGANSVMSSKVKLGADASAAAGPKGRTAGAATDIVMQAEILTYSRARGLFAGVSLEGSTLRSDGDANERLYGRKIEAREIARGQNIAMPSEALPLLALLNARSPRNLSNRPK
jgi:lipid-binding SYLF domain-containing protein